ncbi:MAG: NAD(P)/FAD-dependent oxidoreductase [Xanthomonadales bacterium]|nr:NAD(P)/FAD-dependent oxidoreductase [Xanthomonadales bacterium]
MCAMTAARRGRRVRVLERSNKPGKKILMSGGGRCNFTNLHVAPDRFQSANPHFCKSALSRYTQWDFIELVEQHGIDYFEKETVNGLSGQLFCRESSKQIVAMLLDECGRSGVEITLDCETTKVQGTGPFRLETSEGSLRSETLVVATGGLSIPSLGGSAFGYRLAKQFGMEVLPTSAGLAPFTFSGLLKERFSRLAGVSCEVKARNGEVGFREDLLFTHRGLSGPVVLQLSSHWQPGESITLDLTPGKKLVPELLKTKQRHPRSLLRTQLNDLLPHRLVREIEDLFWSEHADQPLSDWPDRRLEALGDRLQAWRVKPSGTEGYRKAEVTLGGVNTQALSSKTMESHVPGLFLVGEVVDVTGELGGFNFQWAWSSGHAAGQAV